MKNKTIILFFLLLNWAYSDKAFNLGTPASFLQTILTAKNGKSTARLPSTSGEQFQLKITDYNYKNGHLSLTGVSAKFENSRFILKGDKTNLYGWLILIDENLAFEYTTRKSGEFVANEVPLTKIRPICNIQRPHSEELLHKHSSNFLSHLPSGEDIPHIGEYTGEDVTKLQSRPGSDKVIYMDITEMFNGTEPIHLTKKDWWQTWQSLAAGLSMFDVNITTDANVYNNTDRENSAISRFINASDRSNADLNSFGSSGESRMYKENSGYGYGRTLLHEVGHQLGLSHDGGQPGGEYFEGIPTFRWIPIMGNYWFGDDWGEALYQWSKGEYSGASQQEDDLNLIKRYLDYLPDDISGEVPLIYKDGTTTLGVEDNRGQINTNTDSDIFTFQVQGGKGHATLKIDRIEYLGGAMLDVHAEIQDASGQVVAESNPTGIRYAELDVDLDPGAYTLIIRGGAEGTPSNGFPKYSSLGHYAIEGEIIGGVNSQINTAIALSAQADFCEGETLTLTGHSDVSYSYQWYRNGTVMAGSTTNMITVADKAEYYLAITSEGNTVSSKVIETDVISIPSKPIVSVSNCNEGGGSLTLTAQSNGGTTQWFDALEGGNLLYSGGEYTLSMEGQSTIFAAQTSLAPPVSGGPASNNIGEGGFHAGDYYQVFDAQTDVVIASVLVYAQGSKVRKFALKSSGGVTLAQQEISVPDGESRVELNFEVPAGTGYELGVEKLNGVDVDLYRNSNGTNYPYNIEGIVSITGSTAGTSNDYYYYTYDWEVRETGGADCSSSRTQVGLQGCEVGVQALMPHEINITLTHHKQLELKYSDVTRVESIQILSLTGKRYFHTSTSVPIIDVSRFPSGVYWLLYETSDKQIVKPFKLK